MEFAVAAKSTRGESEFAALTVDAWDASASSCSGTACLVPPRFAAGLAAVLAAGAALAVSATARFFAAALALGAGDLLAETADLAAARVGAGSVTLLPTAFFSLVVFAIANLAPFLPKPLKTKR
jgi:hypothetical protein